MKIYLIGAGCGPETRTAEAAEALAAADLVIGAARLLEEAATPGRKAEAVRPEEIMELLGSSGAETVCVLFSGDSGFYSGARRLLPRLAGEDVRVLPGISCVQAFAARLGRPWQDWRLCSAHGARCDPVREVCGGRPVFFLTGGAESPGQLCSALTAAGLGALAVTVGEDLGGPGEAVTAGTAAEFAARRFAPLNVVLAEPAPRPGRRCPGLPDSCFRRAERIPMTKQEVRAAILAKLGVGPEDTCWDIGAGTGSVAVELAIQAGAVWSVERDPAALALAEENRRALGAWNLRLVGGEAPAALRDLPRPDAVFVGGSGGALGDILRAVREANPAARVCVSAIALESLHNAITTVEALGYGTEVVQVAVSRSRNAAGLHLMTAQNPVYLITGTAP